MKQPRFAPLLAIAALAGTAFATQEAGSYLAVSRDSEAILDLFSMPVVGIAVFLTVLILGMCIGLQRSAHTARMEQLERQRQALRRPTTGPVSRPSAPRPRQPVA